MGKLIDIPFEQESQDIKNRVANYWSKRAQGFFEMRQDELKSNKADRWLAEFERATEGRKSLNILDIGCGAGFFEVLLGQSGHRVTGIDLTLDMVTKANQMIKDYGLDTTDVKAMVMDAENPQFENETFDVIITRNLTWTLPHPIEAYQKWYNILKPSGILLNFDAEYAKGAHNLKQPENIAHRLISDELKDECHEIYHMLTISNLNRPQWDHAILNEIGFAQVHIDETFSSRIFKEHDEFYIPDHMFMIKAIK